MLPDEISWKGEPQVYLVSMHLMVLGASRQSVDNSILAMSSRLNAPDGAGCFPTHKNWEMLEIIIRLNAPDGAGCFPTQDRVLPPGHAAEGLNAPDGAGCFPTCRELTLRADQRMSQCT